MTKQLNLGVIGAGKIAGIIVPGLPKDLIRVVAVADVNGDAAHSLAAAIGDGTPAVAADTAALLARPDVEAVYIATPPDSHAALIAEAMGAGKHVLCEKPWTRTEAEARSVAALASENPSLKIACCGSRFRFSRAAEAVVAGLPELGRLRTVRMRAAIGAPAELSDLPGWKARRDTAGGGLVSDWGVYELEWLRAVLGSAFTPVSVYARLDYFRREGSGIESGYTVTIRCESGLLIEMSRMPEVGPQYHQVEIRGDDGGLDAPFAPNEVLGGATVYRRDGSGAVIGTELSDSEPSWTSILSGPFIDFAEAVRDDRPVAADAVSQVMVHRLVDAIYRSGRSGRSASVNPGWKLFPFNNYFLSADRDYTTTEVWDLAKAAGYDKLYFSVGRDNPESWDSALQISEQRRRTGLGLAAVYTVVDLNDPEPEGAHSLVELMDCLEPADIMELALTVGWQTDVSNPIHDEKALALLSRLLSEAKQRGIAISLYHHLGFWMERIDDCVRVAQKIDDGDVGVTFCGFHWYAVDRGDLAAKLRSAAPYLKLVNVCGSRERPEGSDFPLAYTIEPIGEGTFPLQEFVSELRSIDYRGDVGFQGYRMGGHSPSTLARSMAAWRQAAGSC